MRTKTCFWLQRLFEGLFISFLTVFFCWLFVGFLPVPVFHRLLVIIECDAVVTGKNNTLSGGML